MQTSTIILMLVGIVAVLTAVVVVLLWLMHRKDEDIKQKNDVIIHEVRRNQTLIDKAVQNGVNRAALLSWMLAAMMTAMSVQAQKIQTVDKDGQPIPYASIFTETGDIIGTTGLDGILEDVKGAEVVSITHVAYKSKKVKVGQGGRVTLEDADFDLPEITVTKKPLVYVQTYYRIVYQSAGGDLPVYYYRAGVLNNSYDKKTKKVSSDEDHFSACNIGILKTTVNTLLNARIKQMANLKMGTIETRMKQKYKEIGLSFVPDGPGKQRITDKFGTVGSVTDNQGKGERRYSYDSHQLGRHKIQVTGSDKKKAKADKREERKKNRKDLDFTVYRIDEDGNYAPEDFVMQQGAASYDDEKDNDHVNIMIQVFNVDRAYVTKDELKQLKKEKKMKMTYQNLQQFERDHNIPPLPAELQKRINEVVK